MTQISHESHDSRSEAGRLEVWFDDYRLVAYLLDSEILPSAVVVHAEAGKNTTSAFNASSKLNEEGYGFT